MIFIFKFMKFQSRPLWIVEEQLWPLWSFSTFILPWQSLPLGPGKAKTVRPLVHTQSDDQKSRKASQKPHKLSICSRANWDIFEKWLQAEENLKKYILFTFKAKQIISILKKNTTITIILASLLQCLKITLHQVTEKFQRTIYLRMYLSGRLFVTNANLND